MKPFTVEEACKAVSGWQKTPFSGTIQKVTTDSRQDLDQSLFIPLKGEKFDGHAFLQTALEQGACCALSMEATSQERVIYVEDTRRALGALAAWYRRRFTLPVAAITGSVGKTSTKEMTAAVLSAKFDVCKTQGNYNNDIGLPKTLFSLEEHHTAAVVEMGMNHFGELHTLSKMAAPSLAVITNIGVAHIENLGSQEGIFQAKCEIFDGMAQDAPAVLNGDDPYLLTLKQKRKNLLFCGLGEENTLRAKNIRPQGLSQTAFTICYHGQQEEAVIAAAGTHMVQNALLAVGVGLKFGLSLQEAAQALGNFQQTGMRMAVKKTPFLTVLNDSYNANPISTKASLQVLAAEQGRKVAVLGDMLELGPEAAVYHEEVGRFAKQVGIDFLIAIGPFGEYISKGFDAAGGTSVHYPSVDAFFAAPWQTLFHKGDTVLVKASHSMALSRIAEGLQEVNKGV